MDDKYSTGNEIVDRVSEMNITGNIYSLNWFQTIKYKNGKPDVNAIIILSDIVYWYRPTEIRDEGTGAVIGMKKKFKADLLQRSYKQVEERLGLSKRQVKLAVDNLEALGVIKKDFRRINVGGRAINNVLYLESVPEKLAELTYRGNENNSMIRSNVPPITTKRNRVLQSNEGEGTTEVKTNTKITTKITDKEYPILSYQEEVELFKRQVGYDAIRNDMPLEHERLDEIVEIAVEVLNSSKKTVRVNKEDKNVELVKGRLRKLNIEHIKYVIGSLNDNTTEVRNIRAVLITSLYNAPSTISNYYSSKVSHDMCDGIGA